MTLLAVYRYYAGGNLKRRPPFFSKLVCLLSFVRAVDAAPGAIEVVFLVDGAIPMIERSIMEACGRIEYLDASGNSRSYRRALGLATAAPGRADLVYLSEDDYLYLPDCFSALVSAAKAIPEADYFTLYDHPDRYATDPARRERPARLFVSSGRHWRSSPSTCMTFAARTETLRRDRLIHWIGTAKGYPRDDMIWRATQGVSPFRLKFPKRLLVSPLPSLATHMEADRLAPAVDWSAVATEVLHWGATQRVVDVDALANGQSPDWVIDRD